MINRSNSATSSCFFYNSHPGIQKILHFIHRISLLIENAAQGQLIIPGMRATRAASILAPDFLTFWA
jgi:hypothetical protein